ncbi:MAG: hypothetical protein HN509_18105 [Halobacteriovoraceae bacterium]|nr:hypothetical protein [Halobacteriovoraceae bacterium]
MSLLLGLSSCQNNFAKFKTGQCFTEKLRSVASSHSSSEVIYKVKSMERDKYVLYMVSKKRWWFYQKIAWKKFEDGSRGEFSKIRCPKLVKTGFGKGR